MCLISMKKHQILYTKKLQVHTSHVFTKQPLRVQHWAQSSKLDASSTEI